MRMHPLNAEVFTNGLDYAGLFPPALLNLQSALNEYDSLTTGPESSLVRGFAISTSQLANLKHCLLPKGKVLQLCVIGKGADSLESWEANLEFDANEINQAVDHFGDQICLKTYEVRIPAELNPQQAIQDLSGFEEGLAYLELPLHRNEFDLDAFAAAAGTAENVGLKARTGGITSHSVPDPFRLAECIVACSQGEASLKCTAGLHHAYPTLNPETGDTEFGFLNILLAVGLAWEHDYSCSKINEVLTAKSGLINCDHQLEWQKDTLSQNGQFLFENESLSIGTCSVKEIIENLRRELDLV